ncbi:uncharacterized protein LOC142165347 [Nicotiana tabacum]|uniref:Uncharacterized protein LOC142165347 n=1 Tax=Nicotiana tabacum TaxID=4097 RepID=A0AC58S4W7_TOBAC
MQAHANAHRSDKQFNVGDWVFVKLQPYRQSTLSPFPHHKLTSRYFGSYSIVEKVGVGAYNFFFLLRSSYTLPFMCPICYDIPATIVHPPIVHLSSQYFPLPEAVLDRRLIKRDNKVVAPCLVTWTGLDSSYATWELASALKARFPSFTLEDKGVVHLEGIDTYISG